MDRTLILTVFFGWIGDIISRDAVAGKEDEKEGTEKENKENMKNKYQSNSLNLVMKEQKKKVRELHTEVKKVQHMLLLKILNLILVVKMIIGQLKNKMKRIQVQVVIVMHVIWDFSLGCDFVTINLNGYKLSQLVNFIVNKDGLQ